MGHCGTVGAEETVAIAGEISERKGQEIFLLFKVPLYLLPMMSLECKGFGSCYLGCDPHLSYIVWL